MFDFTVAHALYSMQLLNTFMVNFLGSIFSSNPSWLAQLRMNVTSHNSSISQNSWSSSSRISRGFMLGFMLGLMLGRPRAAMLRRRAVRSTRLQVLCARWIPAPPRPPAPLGTHQDSVGGLLGTPSGTPKKILLKPHKIILKSQESHRNAHEFLL